MPPIPFLLDFIPRFCLKAELSQSFQVGIGAVVLPMGFCRVLGPRCQPGASPPGAPGLIQPSERPRVGRGRVGRGPGAGRLLLELIAVFQGVLFPSLKPGRERRQLPGARGSAAQNPAAVGLVAPGPAKRWVWLKKKMAFISIWDVSRQHGLHEGL